MPAQQGRRRDQERCPPLPAEQPGQRGEEGPAAWGVTWPRHLAAEHSQLMAEHSDLDVLLIGRGPEPEQFEEASDDQEGDLKAHPGDPGTCASPLLRCQILSLHPSGSRPWLT